MMDSNVRIGAVVVIALIGVGLTAQYFLSGSLAQPFSEVGILGPNGQFSGYPSTMTAGQNYTLNLYVSNQEGHSMMYQVYEKLGSKTSVINQTTPLSSKPVATYGFVLPNNGTEISPITVNIATPGLNIRIVWELWDFVPATNSWEYEGSWAQIFVNATV